VVPPCVGSHTAADALTGVGEGGFDPLPRLAMANHFVNMDDDTANELYSMHDVAEEWVERWLSAHGIPYTHSGFDPHDENGKRIYVEDANDADGEPDLKVLSQPGRTIWIDVKAYSNVEHVGNIRRHHWDRYQSLDGEVWVFAMLVEDSGDTRAHTAYRRGDAVEADVSVAPWGHEFVVPELRDDTPYTALPPNDPSDMTGRRYLREACL